MSILLSAILLCGSVVESEIVDNVIWRENGQHIFITEGWAYDVGGECYDMTECGGIYKYTWVNPKGTHEISYVKAVFVEIDGNLIRVEE